tara:strand:+ start:8093 stop:8566 length:474 start_codon:yes stop_codon:yes gene_type:complete
MGEKKFMNCVLVNCSANDEILLLFREKEPYKDHWALIGGKMEFGEHPEETALRELYEETGIKGNCNKVSGIISEVCEGDLDLHFIMFYCDVIPESKEIKQMPEGEVKWFNKNNLPEKIVPSDKKMIEMFKDAEHIKILKAHMTQTEGKIEMKRWEHA